MPYPPIVPPNTRQNTTPLIHNHPSDHNVLSDAINDIVMTLGSNPAGAYADLEDRVNAIEALVQSVSPVGMILPWASTTVPQGFLACNGQSLVQSQFPALFGVLGTTHGGDATTFKLPDMRTRMVAGYTSEDALFSTFGAKQGDRNAPLATHTHTAPRHRHGMRHIHGVEPVTNATVQPFSYGGRNWHVLVQSTGGVAAGGIQNKIFWWLDNAPGSMGYAGVDGTPLVPVTVPAHNTNEATWSGAFRGESDDGGDAATTNPLQTHESPANRNMPPFITLMWVIRTGL